MNKILKNLLVNLMTSKNLSYIWNFGSFLGLIFSLQIITGIFLLFYYSNESIFSFFSVNYLMMESKMGWFFRILHFNGASLFFIFLFLHFFKALLYKSYRLKMVWLIGLIMLIMLMLEAFTGYCLVWAQMSFWASVVITSLVSVLPKFGMNLVYWIWGGFSVSFITLKFFFVLHFILPFFLIFFVFLHLVFLHNTGSTSKMLTFNNSDKIMFYNFFWLKDLLNIYIIMMYFILVLLFPFKLGDPEMFIESDFLNSPLHIIPEWYFLFAYAILRAIPNKIFGVLFLMMSLLMWSIFIMLNLKKNIFNNINKMIVFFFLFNGIFLSWLGQCLVESPYVIFSMISSFIYFLVMMILFYKT